jgi:hypothetical protein
LKGLTRTNEAIDKKAIHGFIATLDVTEEVRAELMQITPSNWEFNSNTGQYILTLYILNIIKLVGYLLF